MALRQLAFGIGGGILGGLGAAYSHYQAQAAVKVRPNLAEVGFIDATLTNHAADWIFYHHPVVGTAIMVVLFAMFGLVGGAMFK